MNEVNLSSLVLLFSLRKHLLVFDEERPERQVIWTGFVSTHFPSLSSTLSLLVEEGIPCINEDSCFRIVNVFNCTRKEFVTTTIFVRDLSSYCWRNLSLLTWLLTAPRHPFRPPHPTNSFWARWKFPPSLYIRISTYPTHLWIWIPQGVDYPSPQSPYQYSSNPLNLYIIWVHMDSCISCNGSGYLDSCITRNSIFIWFQSIRKVATNE